MKKSALSILCKTIVKYMCAVSSFVKVNGDLGTVSTHGFLLSGRRHFTA